LKISRYIQRLFCAGLLLSLFILPSFTQEEGDGEDVFLPLYDLGDQMMTINAGLFIPLFYQSSGGAVSPTNLTVGGLGSLQWNAFLNNDMSVGVEVAGMFAFSPNRRTLFMLPITGRYTYFIRSYPFEFPIFIGAGINFSRLSDSTHVELILKPGFSALWNYNAEWSFGLSAVYWWIPQIYLGPSPPQSHTRFGNFMETSISALYHF
jgi:hypothetical protein